MGRQDEGSKILASIKSLTSQQTISLTRGSSDASSRRARARPCTVRVVVGKVVGEIVAK